MLTGQAGAYLFVKSTVCVSAMTKPLDNTTAVREARSATCIVRPVDGEGRGLEEEELQQTDDT